MAPTGDGQRHGYGSGSGCEDERRLRPGVVGGRAGDGRAGGRTDRDGGAEPGERLGLGAGRRRVVDHGVDDGVRRRDRRAAEHEHGRHRGHAAGGRDEQQVTTGERGEHEREAGRAAQARPEADGGHAADQRSGAPQAEQRAGRRGAAEPRGGGRNAHLDGAEENADGDQHEHESAHRRGAQAAAAAGIAVAGRAPAA